MKKHVGFTGTRRGMTDRQIGRLSEALITLKSEGFSIFHHGDCIGADEEAHDVAVRLGYTVVVHPPNDSRARAFKPSSADLPEKPYLARNHDIVDACAVLLAAPVSSVEELRSGTWATVRYSKKTGTIVKLVLP